jgi:hypothetical protein
MTNLIHISSLFTALHLGSSSNLFESSSEELPRIRVGDVLGHRTGYVPEDSYGGDSAIDAFCLFALDEDLQSRELVGLSSIIADAKARSDFDSDSELLYDRNSYVDPDGVKDHDLLLQVGRASENSQAGSLEGSRHRAISPSMLKMMVAYITTPIFTDSVDCLRKMDRAPAAVKLNKEDLVRLRHAEVPNWSREFSTTNELPTGNAGHYGPSEVVNKHSAHHQMKSLLGSSLLVPSGPPSLRGSGAVIPTSPNR